MTFILILQITLCLITLGTVIPTVYLGYRIRPVDQPVFLGVSGLLIGIMFVINNIKSKSDFSSLWGTHAWFSMVILLVIFAYINHYPEFSLKKALWLNFFMQGLLLSAIPMSQAFLHDISIIERIIAYSILILSFVLVIYNSSIFLLSHASIKKVYNRGIYIYAVIILLIGFEPLTMTPSYIELMAKYSTVLGLFPLELSLIIHLIVIPLISFIPYRIIKQGTCP